MSQKIAILGAGPTGLEAALAASEAGHSFTLYEAAPRVAGSVRDWGHVRLFTPWELNVSPRARRFLEAAGVPVPDGAACPTGHELCQRLLEPLAALPAVAPHLRLGTRVAAVGRQGLLKHEEIASPRRAGRPFRLLVEEAAGAGAAEGVAHERLEQADVVIDCTGAYALPNRLGDGGIPAPGERTLEPLIRRRIPDFAAEAAEWAGKTVLLVGAGHSAQTAAGELAKLARSAPGTRVIWALRSAEPTFGAVADDPLPDRARLAAQARHLAEGGSPAVEARTGVVVESLRPDGDGAAVTLRRTDGATEEVRVDRILALTGSVGDHHLYRQLQVHECYATSGPMKLSAALLSSGAAGGGDCLAQTSQGAETLRNPEPGFFILGAKSYGRNNTFLMRLGWQQVDEVMSLLAG